MGSRKCRSRPGGIGSGTSEFGLPRDGAGPFYFNPGSQELLLPLHSTRPTAPTVCRRSIHSIPKRPVLSAPNPENGNGGPPPVLHFPTLQNVRGRGLQFQSFDESYLSRLRSGDFRTQENFSSYFSALIKIKLGARLKSPEAIEDVRQETFARFFLALRDGKILQPDRLGSFVNSICNNVLLEHYRSAARNTPLDEGEEKNFRNETGDYCVKFSWKSGTKMKYAVTSASIANICACCYTVPSKHLSHRI